MSTGTVQRKVFYRDDNFSLEYERLLSKVVVHLSVENFSHSVMRKIYREAVRFESEMWNQGVEEIVTFTPNPTFARMLVGEKRSELEYEGVIYEEFVWDLKYPH